MKRDCILLKEKPRQSIFWSTLMLLTLGMGMAIFYEATGERKYWVNRWRLWRSLRAGRVRLEREGETTNTWSMWIDDRRYVLQIFTKDNPDSSASVYLSGSSWIIRDDNFTVSEWKQGFGGLFTGETMIGLFNGSLITNFLRKSSYKMLLDLTDPAKARDKKLERIGI